MYTVIVETWDTMDERYIERVKLNIIVDDVENIQTKCRRLLYAMADNTRCRICGGDTVGFIDIYQSQNRDN